MVRQHQTMYGVSEDELGLSRLAIPKQVVDALWWIGEDCRICIGARANHSSVSAERDLPPHGLPP